MQSKKIHLAVPTTGDSVGDMGALSSVLFAREELIKQGYLVKVLCFASHDELIADVARYKPRFAVVVEGHGGKVDLEVYHQVLPDWDRYKGSYMAALGVIHHSTRFRKLHNRYVQAGYTMQWMQNINAPAVYVRLGVGDKIDMNEMYMQGRAILCSVQNQAVTDI